MTIAVRIDAEDPTPPYEQLRRQLAALIKARTLENGSRLAPVRQLAGDLGIAPGTVSRAYRELEAAGLVRTRRGGGTVITCQSQPLSGTVRHDRLAALLGDAVRQARLLGATDTEIVSHVHQAL